MILHINGEPHELPAPQTLASVLLSTGHGQRRVAAEVNLQIIPKSQHHAFALSDGDHIEIIQAIGGG